MKLLIVTTVASPHMLPLSKEFKTILGDGNFTFSVTEPDFAWRSEMGWPEDRSGTILRRYASENELKKYEALWDESDVVLASIRDVKRMKKRVAKGKLTFYASERWFKPPYGHIRMLFPKWRSMVNDFRAMSSSSNFHYLPIGPYAARDLSPLAFPPDHCHSWGYFVEPSSCASIKTEGPLNIMYAGRMLRWKHPEDIVRGFGMLNTKYPDSRLVIVGDGERSNTVAKLVNKLNLKACVELMGFRPMEEVWAMMEKAHVFVLASGEEEGWGAVINEAMARRCAIVASRDSGAAAAMLEHGKNALVFASRDWQTLGNHLIDLAGDRDKLARLSSESKRCIDTLWSSETAANRFIETARAMLDGQIPERYPNGPMAPIV